MPIQIGCWAQKKEPLKCTFTFMEPGRKNDRLDHKLRWELLPLRLIEMIVEVYTFGANKYAPNTWQNLPDGYNRYKAALLRHIVAHEKGEFLDSESHLPHLAHAAWNAIAMLYFGFKEKENKETNNGLATPS